jgi:hypothetical protein
LNFFTTFLAVQRYSGKIYLQYKTAGHTIPHRSWWLQGEEDTFRWPCYTGLGQRSDHTDSYSPGHKRRCHKLPT